MFIIIQIYTLIKRLADNPHLIYALIRAHRRIEELASFTLPTAVAEIRRSARPSRPGDLKATLSSASLTSFATGNETKSIEDNFPNLNLVPSPAAVEVPDEPFPVRSEKARGKMRAMSFSEGETDVNDSGSYVSRTGFVPTEACKFLCLRNHYAMKD